MKYTDYRIILWPELMIPVFKKLKDHLDKQYPNKASFLIALLLRLRSLYKSAKKKLNTFRNFDFELFYYKRVYLKKILRSKAIICDRNSEFELHMLVCENCVFNSIWCLKTFYHYSGLRPKLVIHDDGTLSASSKKIYLRHFVNCTLIAKDKANNDLMEFLKDFKFSSKYRFSNRKDFILSMKLFDFYYYSMNKSILALDADVLFFKKPIEIIECIKKKQGFFMSDYQDAYSIPVDRLNILFGLNIRSKVNTGIYYRSKKEYYDMDVLERFLEEVHNSDCHRLLWIEQTGQAIFFSKYKNAFTRLGDSYQISKQPITDKIISHHFVSDKFRNNFYTEGLRHLCKINFLKELNRAVLSSEHRG